LQKTTHYITFLVSLKGYYYNVIIIKTASAIVCKSVKWTQKRKFFHHIIFLPDIQYRNEI